MRNPKLIEWVAGSAKFLDVCESDDRLAALPLLYAKVVVDGIAKGTSMTPSTRNLAEADLAKHLIRHVAAFVSENRTIWLRNGKP